MKNALFAVACTLGVVACGDSRPSASPASESTTTTVTSETSSVGANGALPKAKPTAGLNSTPTSADRGAPTTTANTGADTTRATPAPASDPATMTGGAAPVAQNPGAADGTKDATNTKMNERDRSGAALTPMDQGGGKDRDITAAIRRSVVGDGSLSFNAKNVKIITVGGKVTLRGPVKSDAEKATIESKAKAAVGVTEVDNQLEVKK